MKVNSGKLDIGSGALVGLITAVDLMIDNFMGEQGEESCKIEFASSRSCLCYVVFFLQLHDIDLSSIDVTNNNLV
jgi:hypothetical protein